MTSPSKASTVEEHYGSSELANRVIQALKNSYGENKNLSWADLAPLDQFHVRGLAATKELAEGFNLRPGAKVLDVGCGLGGPARFLAANYKCDVTAIDLSASFIEVARVLTERTSLDVKYQVMDALKLSFEDSSFDDAWTQHVAMNIRDRAQLYANVHRVLRAGGRFAIYDVVAGSTAPLLFPVPWARTPDISFLLTAQQMREALSDAGFAEISWIDKTAEGIEWFEQMLAASAARQPQPALSLNLVMGPEFAGMAANLNRNFKEGRAGIVQAIVQKR